MLILLHWTMVIYSVTMVLLDYSLETPSLVLIANELCDMIREDLSLAPL